MSPEVWTRQYWQIRRVALRKRHPILIPKLHLVEYDPHTSWLNNSELYSYYGFVNCTLMCHFLVDQCPTGGPFQQWQYKNTWQDELVCRHPLVAMAPCHHWALTNGLGRLYLSLCWPWFSHTPAPDKNLQWGSKNIIFSTWPFLYQNGGQCYNENPHCLYFPLKLGSVSEAAKYFTFFSPSFDDFQKIIASASVLYIKDHYKGWTFKKKLLHFIAKKVYYQERVTYKLLDTIWKQILEFLKTGLKMR